MLKAWKTFTQTVQLNHTLFAMFTNKCPVDYETACKIGMLYSVHCLFTACTASSSLPHSVKHARLFCASLVKRARDGCGDWLSGGTLKGSDFEFFWT